MGTALPLRGTGLLFAGAILALLPQAAQCAEDPWQSGYRLEAWNRIEALQRYPVYDDGAALDWPALGRDPDPLVRAATALAAVRAPDAARLPVLRPMLADPHPLVRRLALEALLGVRSPLVREPVLEVLGTWPDFKDIDPAPFAWLGLPWHLAGLPLRDRQEWIKAFADGWTVSTGGRPYREWAEDFEITLCPQASEVDAGSPIPVRFRVLAIGKRRWVLLSLSTWNASWHPVSPEGTVPSQDVYDWRLQFPRHLADPKPEKIEVSPGENGPFDVTLATAERPADPGIYVLRVFGAPPVLMRVRRSAAMERQIPELLKNPAASAQLLGRQRVAAAAAPLLEVFRNGAASGRTPHGFAVAEALGRLGDRAAIPILLDHPLWQDGDLFGDTSGALKMFGRAAWPEYEKRILSWRARLTTDPAYGLALSLGLLGPHGSAETDQARLQIVCALVREVGDNPNRDPRAPVLRAAVMASIPGHPDEVADAIVAAIDRPAVAILMIQQPRQFWGEATEPRDRIFRELWRRLRGRDDLPEYLRRSLVEAVADAMPEVLADDPSPITSPEEARAVVRATLSSRVAAGRPARERQALLAGTARRVEDYLQKNPDPRFHLSVAELYLALRDYDRCREILRDALPQFKEDWQVVTANMMYGQVLLADQKFDEAVQAFERAAARATSLSTLYGNYSGFDVRSRLEAAREWPRRADLRVRTVGAARPDDFGWPLELKAGRAIGIDPKNRLRVLELLKQEDRTGVMFSHRPRAVAGLDDRRVFVAQANGMAGVYEIDGARPVWERPLAVCRNAHLSATPQTITAADLEGTLHVIDLATGATRWTRKVKPVPWEEYVSSEPSLVRQHRGGLLVPDGPKMTQVTQLEWADLATGQSRWTYRPPFIVEKAALDDVRLYVAGRTGHIAAVSLETGKEVWQAKFDADAALSYYWVDLAADGKGRLIYFAVGEMVRALDPATGRVVWQWAWRPRQKTDKPLKMLYAAMWLVPAGDDLFCLVGWSGPPDVLSKTARVDVVRLAPDGAVRLHETSPSHDGGWGAFADGNLLVRYVHQAIWEVWEFLPPAGPGTQATDAQ